MSSTLGSVSQWGRLYLVGSAQAFRDGRMGVDQVPAVRPGVGRVSGMPWKRDR